MAVPDAKRQLSGGFVQHRLLAACVLLCAAFAHADDRPSYVVYLAGPEVFLPNAREAGEDKKRLIERLNASENWPFKLVGLYPLDNEIPDFAPDRETGIRIYRANIAMMDRAHAVVANMVRFRGPGMDGGTAFEMGYMRGLGKPVFAYYDAEPFYGEAEPAGLYPDRVRRLVGQRPDNAAVDVDGLLIEDFGMADNLMMIGALDDSRVTLQASFEQALMRVAEHVARQR